MTTTFPQFQQTVPWMLAAVLMGQPGSLRAEDRPDSLVDLARQNRLLLLVGPFAVESGSGDRTAGASGGGVVARSFMLHRFTAELIDSLGRPAPMAGIRWSATLHMQQGVGMPIELVHLGPASPTVVLPKLLGYRIDAGDLLGVRIVLLDPPAAVGAIHLRVAIDYEPLDGPVSRWAVVPAGLQFIAASTTSGTWDWTADVTGRVLALAGLPLHGATELVFQNAATGAVLWRMSIPRTDAAAFARPGNFVRLGIHAVAGETYRLTVSHDGNAVTASTAAEGVQVMLLPRRATVTAAAIERTDDALSIAPEALQVAAVTTAGR